MVCDIKEDKKDKSGIYTIRNSVNKRVYVGSAFHLYKRFTQHLSGLKNGRHANVKLRNFSLKYGYTCLTFSVLEVCPKEQVLEREQYWIDYFDSACPKNGFNIKPIAGRGVITDEQKEENLRKSLEAGTKVKKVCAACQKEFLHPASQKNAKYCSVACQGIGKRRTYKLLKECKVCKKEFDATLNKHTIYCSQRCMGMGKRKEYPLIECEWCKEKFKKRTHSKNIFCSKGCSAKARAGTKRPPVTEATRIKMSASLKGRIPHNKGIWNSDVRGKKKTCPVCKVEFVNEGYYDRKFCTKACSLKGRPKKNRLDSLTQ